MVDASNLAHTSLSRVGRNHGARLQPSSALAGTPMHTAPALIPAPAQPSCAAPQPAVTTCTTVKLPNPTHIGLPLWGLMGSETNQSAHHQLPAPLTRTTTAVTATRPHPHLCGVGWAAKHPCAHQRLPALQAALRLPRPDALNDGGSHAQAHKGTTLRRQLCRGSGWGVGRRMGGCVGPPCPGPQSHIPQGTDLLGGRRQPEELATHAQDRLA